MTMTILRGFWRLWKNIMAEPNAPGTCPGCGHANDVWQEDVIRDGYIETRLWRGCPMYRIALAQPFNFEEMNRHWAKWTMTARKPLHG